MASREASESSMAERDRLYRLSMLMGSALLRDIIAAEHPRIMQTLLKKQKGK